MAQKSCSIPKPENCPHCSNAVTTSMLHYPFCCSGCSFAFTFLQSNQLSEYYRLRDVSGVPVGESDPLSDGLLIWSTSMVEQAEKIASNGIAQMVVEIQGIHCAACLWVIEKLFNRKRGAKQIIINPTIGQMKFVFECGVFDAKEFLSEIWRIGYHTCPVGGGKFLRTDDGLYIRFGISAALTMNSMMLSLSTYFGLAKGNDPLLFSLFMWANFAISCLNLVVGGWVFARSAMMSLMRGLLHLDLPIAIGMLLSFLGSAWAFFQGRETANYFDTVNVFITLMLLGRILLQRVVDQNKKRILNDNGVDRIFVRRVSATGDVHVVSMKAINENDVMLLSRGEVLPVQSRQLDDIGEFSLEWICGESESTTFAKGSLVPAGAIYVGPSAITLKACNAAGSSELSELLISKTQTEDVRFVPLLNKISGYYVLGVLSLATLGFLLWQPVSLMRGLDVAIGILVVTCPCALGLAMPLALNTALAGLRQNGVFVRRMDFLERLLNVRKVIFDKTGTLTLSEHEVTKVEGEPLTQQEQVALYQCLVRSNHPKSKSIEHYFAKTYGTGKINSSCNVTEVAGKGMQVESGGHSYRLGSSEFAVAGSAHTGTVFSRDGKWLQTFTLQERLKHDTLLEVKRLKQRSLAIYLLSGDVREKVDAVAHQLEIDEKNIYWGQSPEQKAQIVERLDCQDTLMIGDGINDSLAFEKAFCRGTPAVGRPTLPGKADFYFWGVGVGPIDDMFVVAKRLKSVLRRNLFYALSYNVIAVGLSLVGLMTPIWAAILMPSSSILIILATLFSLRRPTYEYHRRYSLC